MPLCSCESTSKAVLLFVVNRNRRDYALGNPIDRACAVRIVELSSSVQEISVLYVGRK